MTNKEKQITKGEIGNVVGGYPVFELIVDKKLKRVVLLDDVQKFLDKALKSQKKDIAEKIEKILTRHSNWKPTCGYESEEEKGYQEGLQAEAGLIEKEIKEELNLITKEDGTK